MSQLQMIVEEDSESMKPRKKKAFGTTVVCRPEPQSSAVPQSSTPPLYSVSEESSEGELSDPEIQKIKELTKHLQSNVCSEIKHHKKAYQQYIETNKNLDSIVKDYTCEIEEVKSTAYSALAQSFHTCAEIRKARESVTGRDSRTEDRDPVEILKNMKKEIMAMQERLYANEMIIGEKEKENLELKNIIEKASGEKGSVIEGQERHVGCSRCVIS